MITLYWVNKEQVYMMLDRGNVNQSSFPTPFPTSQTNLEILLKKASLLWSPPIFFIIRRPAPIIVTKSIISNIVIIIPTIIPRISYICWLLLIIVIILLTCNFHFYIKSTPRQYWYNKYTKYYSETECPLKNISWWCLVLEVLASLPSR